ncbi:SGNH/GDSL hydrolase family protein [Dictyobacter kobayashii]|uniref:SGNH hydrolase-type esterase domain-containing protein n=1 Tax=Dictyobacter kobayashii TaxID=2014872 RepID=A0A402AX44_9CHLR|nr:SGNH/GDSL hydrolase family protein [Dictyobacter kobayashii]GCE23639.1 hypothetical protein KDK_74390 [Dictyobacter kobayashii]
MLKGMMKPLIRIVAPAVFVLSLLLLPTPSAFAATHATTQPALVGPKANYLAVGDSLAYGFQPDLDFSHGYADDFYANLKSHGTTGYANMACPGETTTSMIYGDCSVSFLRKFPYIGSQLNAAVLYLKFLAGRVSPVTLDIGANDMRPDINTSTCTLSSTWNSDLARMDTNLRQVILPKLAAAMTVHGQRSGDLFLMNYYDPYQNICPTMVPYALEINQHLAADASGYATVVDVFTPFGGTATPNPNICSYTWMCSIFKDIHAKAAGYRVIANAFEQTAGY